MIARKLSVCRVLCKYINLFVNHIFCIILDMTLLYIVFFRDERTFLKAFALFLQKNAWHMCNFDMLRPITSLSISIYI